MLIDKPAWTGNGAWACGKRRVAGYLFNLTIWLYNVVFNRLTDLNVFPAGGDRYLAPDK
jgi:hypothetical protein